VTAIAIALALLMTVTVVYVVRLTQEREATARQAARTERLQEFIVGLFTGQDPETGPAHDVTVRTLLERGAITADSLQAEPEIRAELKQTLGTIFDELGDFERAATLLTQSLAEKRRLLPGADRRIIEAMLALGFLRADQSDDRAAGQLADDAMAAGAARLSNTDRLAIRARLLIGKVLVGEGKYDQAIGLLGDVVGSADVARPNVDQALAITELANAHQYAGHLDEADRLNRRVLDIDRRLYGETHPSVADDLLNLASAAATRAEYVEAERMERQALAIFEKWYGADHPETGSAKMILAQAVAPQGRLDEAASLLESARAIFVRAYPQPHRRLGLVLNGIGNIASQRGRHAEALDAFTKALAVYREVYRDGKSQYIAVGLANLGSAYADLGRYVDAEKSIREAVALSTTIVTTNHPNTAIAQIKLGRVLLKQQRHAEAVAPLEEGCGTLARIQRVSSPWLQRCPQDLAAARGNTRP
jgi:eukaryotic-like serine/threonine-protein kinase